MKRKSAIDTSDESGRQYHIGCAPGDLAEHIIMVGDPARAKKVAEHFDSIDFETQHREYVTLTGKMGGKPISVMATGMGQDTTEIAVIEICQVTKNPILLRCGSCGLLKEEMNVGDLVITQGSVRLDGTTRYFVHEGFPAIAHHEVVLALIQACSEKDFKFHLGITASAPGFYGPQSRPRPGFPVRDESFVDGLQKMNVSNLEMETSTLLTLAALRGIRAGAICAGFANRRKNEFIDAKTQKEAEARCIEAAIEAMKRIQAIDEAKAERKIDHWFPESKGPR